MTAQKGALFSVAFLCISHLIGMFKETCAVAKIDTNGYVAYCPCMGRFGNQADQFLGALAFAKALDRTLILPPWVEYRKGQRNAVMVPFDSYFKVEPLSAFAKVVTMESFMKDLASDVWPIGHRLVFCYADRHGAKKGECNAKEGNPFGPFWDWFNIDFDGSIIFGPLYYDTSKSSKREWMEKYPAKDYPVLAFVGPPGAFPVTSHNAKLHRFLEWSDKYSYKADEFIEQNIGEDRPFIALHLRNGIDFERACQHVKESPNMFAARQCIGERGQFGTTTHEMCFPSVDTVVEQVKKEVERMGAKSIFIATDSDDLIPAFKTRISNVKFVRQPNEASPHLDLAILGRADHLIGNCVSTFTAFAKRERDVRGLPTSFWAFEPKLRKPDEL